MEVSAWPNLRVSQNIAIMDVRKERIIIRDCLHRERIVGSQRNSFELLLSNLRHDLLDFVELPSEEIIEDLRRALVASALALPLHLEIIQRLWAAWLLAGGDVAITTMIGPETSRRFLTLTDRQTNSLILQILQDRSKAKFLKTVRVRLASYVFVTSLNELNRGKCKRIDSI